MKPKNIALGVIGAVLMLLLSSCKEPPDEYESARIFGGDLLARGGIKNVRKFKDRTYIHGLNYFYFQAKPPEVNRLISWLEFKRVEEIPSPESQVVKAAVSSAGWQFGWNTAQIYVAYYCNSPDSEGRVSSVDILLVSNGEGIYITQGWLPENATRTTDRRECGTDYGSRPQGSNK